MTTKLSGVALVNSNADSTVIGANIPAAAQFTYLLAANNIPGSFAGQGAHIAWNTADAPAGSGGTAFVNNKGLGAGGFVFHNTGDATIGTLIAYIDATGNIVAGNHVIASADLYAGAAGDHVVHAASLTGYAAGQSLKGNVGNNYWIKDVASGLIRQWGTANAAAGGPTPCTVVFPLPTSGGATPGFQTVGSIQVVITAQNFGANPTRNPLYFTAAPTVNGFTAQSDSSSISFSWQAIGY